MVSNLVDSCGRCKVGKRLGVEPVAQLHEKALVQHIGTFPVLEDQMGACVAGMDSPD